MSTNDPPRSRRLLWSDRADPLPAPEAPKVPPQTPKDEPAPMSETLAKETWDHPSLGLLTRVASPLVVLDGNQNIVALSREAERLLRTPTLRSLPLRGMPLRQAFPALALWLHEQLGSEEVPEERESPVLPLDDGAGSPRFLRASLRAITLQLGGRTRGGTPLLQVRLQRVRTEDFLREQVRSLATRYQTIFEGAASAIAVFSPQGLLVEANPRWSALFGTSPTGRSLSVTGTTQGELTIGGPVLPMPVRLAARSPMRGSGTSQVHKLSMLGSGPASAPAARGATAAAPTTVAPSQSDAVAWWDLLPVGHDLRPFGNLLQQLVAGQHRFSDLPFRAHDGHTFVGEMTASLVQDVGTSWILLLVEDVTDQRELEEQLLQSEKMAAVGTLASGIAHELNTPLAAIELIASNALEEGVDDPSLAGDLAKIRDRVEMAARIVRDLLHYSRRGSLHRAEVCIDDQVAAAIADLQPVPAGVTITTALAPGRPLLRADPYQVREVLINLLSNAIDALEAGGGGTVEISTAIDGEEMEVSVRDDGPGFSKEALARLFIPFFTTKPVGKGTGLGLAVCHQLVRAHQGTISASNVAAGGARVVVRLPGVCHGRPSGG